MRKVIRVCMLAAVSLLSLFWAGLLLFCFVAFARGGVSAVGTLIEHLFSNPFQGQPPSSAVMIGVLCGYGVGTASLWYLYWRLFPRGRPSR